MATVIPREFRSTPTRQVPPYLRRLGRVLFFLVAFFATLWSGRVYATVPGDPASRFFAGDLGLGAPGSDFRETLFLHYGATDAAALSFLAGRVSFPGMRGTEFGAGLPYKIGPEFFADRAPTRLGAFGFYRAGSENADIEDVDFTLLDAGFGVSIMPDRHLLLFDSALFRSMEIDFHSRRIVVTDALLRALREIGGDQTPTIGGSAGFFSVRMFAPNRTRPCAGPRLSNRPLLSLHFNSWGLGENPFSPFFYGQPCPPAI